MAVIGGATLARRLSVAELRRLSLPLEAWLLFGGWGAPAYRNLVRLEARLHGPRPCFDLTGPWRAAGSVPLDVAACLEGADR